MGQNLCRYNRPLCHKKKLQKQNLNLKYVTMINPMIGWFEITQYDNKIVISIANLVETTW